MPSATCVLSKDVKMTGQDRQRTGLSRRRFLAGLGLSAAASPFVPLLNASGQEMTQPKRLVLFFTPHGTIWDQWLPTGAETSFTLSPILSPLARHQNRLTVLAGLAIPDQGVGAPHTKGSSLLWTGSTLADDNTFARSDCSGGCTFGWNSGPSVDQMIVQTIKPPTVYKSLQFGDRCGSNTPACRMIYTAAQQPLGPETDPWAAFTRIFGPVTDPTGFAKQQASRRSSLDAVQSELQTLLKAAPAADRAKIQAHLDAVRSLEQRLTTALPRSCTAPTLPTKVAAHDPMSTPTLMDAHFDLMASALACDLTRVMSYQHVVADNDATVYTWLSHTDPHHSMTHAPDSDKDTWAKVQQIYTWYATKFAELLDRLAAIPEGSGSVLDNTIVVWGSELGKANTHSLAKVPFVVAGGGGGTLRPGRFLQFADGVTHNRLLVSLCQAMGATAIQSVGNTDPSSGPLPGLLA